MYGPSHWEELLRIEADIRKQKKEHDHKKIEMKRKITEVIAGLVLFIIITGSMVGLVWLGTQ
jgi:cell division protein FtsB